MRYLKKIGIPCLARLAKWGMAAILKTCRIEVRGLEELRLFASQEKCLLMVWHNRLAILPFFLSHYATDLRFAAVVSDHGDGQILSDVIASCPNGSVISCDKKEGHHAIREMIRVLEEEKAIVILTPDGPKGPLYEVKPGIALAALKTGAAVVRLNWEGSAYWELSTWDKQRIPKPFSKIQIVFGAPRHFAKGLSVKEVQEQLRD